MLFKYVATAALAISLPTLAISQEVNLLKTYALIAKLEANVAEAASAVPLAVALAGDAKAVASAKKDFAKDKAQLESHLATLRTMRLSQEQTKELAKFEANWAELSLWGENILLTPVLSEPTLLAWWKAMHGLEETIDLMLEAMLLSEDIQLED